MKTWPVQDAKARFSEMLEACRREGPQLVTKRGADAAVLVPIEEWERLKETRRPTLKELLLSENGPHDLIIPPRRGWRRRPPPKF
jgi:antitoxin Phd